LLTNEVSTLRKFPGTWQTSQKTRSPVKYCMNELYK
jgi:hypothetical protein